MISPILVSALSALIIAWTNLLALGLASSGPAGLYAEAAAVPPLSSSVTASSSPPYIAGTADRAAQVPLQYLSLSSPQRVLQRIDMQNDAGNARSSTIQKQKSVLLPDVIGKENRISIFAGFTRDIDDVSSMLENAKLQTIILAPDNAALQALPRKPWEDSKQYNMLGSGAYTGAAGSNRAQQNLRSFVQAHLVSAAPWLEHQRITTLAGNEIWWEMKGGTRWIQPGNIEVSGIISKVANGEIWTLRGCLAGD